MCAQTQNHRHGHVTQMNDADSSSYPRLGTEFQDSSMLEGMNHLPAGPERPANVTGMYPQPRTTGTSIHDSISLSTDAFANVRFPKTVTTNPCIVERCMFARLIFDK